MNRRAGIILAAMALYPGAARTCDNYYATTLRGAEVDLGEYPETIEPGPFYRSLVGHPARSFWEGQEIVLAQQVKAGGDYKVSSDYAAVLGHLGRSAEAIEILENIERQHPGEYITAGNLGTAYELHGDLQKALRWIQEGIRRNPGSHEGTEWLHVKIIEARIALAADPAWLNSHSVLGYDFGEGAVPSMPAQCAGEQAHVAERALMYQLHERLQFVDPPNPVVADLLFDLSNLVALRSTVEHATPICALALSYGPERADLVQSRLDRYRELANADPWIKTLRGFYAGEIALGVLCVAGIVGGAVAWRRARARRS